MKYGMVILQKKEMNIYKNRDINASSTMLEALKKMDQIDKKLLIVIDDDLFQGLLSAGDIQRAIIKNAPLSTPISQITRKNIKVAKPTDSFEEIKTMMQEYRMEFCPIVDTGNQITNIYFWEDLFSTSEIEPKNKFELPVVVMAGGFGTRLKPITNVLPKPLIPIGEKTMLEEIFFRFSKYGCKNFHVSVNYKADLIEYYIKNQELPFNINFFKEPKPLGTAGSLTLLKQKIDTTFFINNCDILIESDYSEIVNYHQSQQNEITIIAALKSYSIPYGTIESGNNGDLIEIIEKPEFTFKINSGMYLLEPHLLNEIPDDEFFHITDLIQKVKQRNGKIGVYPISEKSWKDIGDWNEYLKIINK